MNKAKSMTGGTGMEVRGRQLRVAVVGAGAAGLCAARHLAARPEAFAPPVVFEASAQLGGTWVYSEERPFGKGPPLPCNMYRDLRTNLPKEAMAFPDFPFEVALPSFLPRAAVLSYLEHYTESHGLRGYIRFQRLVKQVTPVDGPESGWDVTSSQATGGGEQETERFDAIMVCSGHYSTPFIPSISGLETFTGQVLHSRDYRCPEPFAGHSVVLVGAGPSGVDLAQQLAPLARCVTLSHSQVRVRGLPAGVGQAAPVTSVAGPLVRFADGAVQVADTLVLCTGYAYRLPFLPAARLGLCVGDHLVAPLYRHLLPPQHPCLFLVGLCQQICPFPHFHVQVLFCLAVLTGTCLLPPAPERQVAAEEELRVYLAAGGSPRHFHRLGVRQWGYLQELAQLGGFPPLPPVIQKIYDDTRERRTQDVGSYRDCNYRVLGAEEWELVG
ncbi:flavin-containing monooxygenase FMO GS-OX4-like isoform X2 [Alligator sinensis]|uniref:Flavin-containing monooxygenase n=1 Tax=Alligator sinensis TaxID=38654 RepID=A0A1U8DCY7_ALLSI|nr:flavin-containing monooxygenase FMO GS-OX4-like isoform X2 [Alligator sinensis]